MPKPAAPYAMRSKLWIEDSNGEVVFGMGRIKMLQAIERCGSLNGAAKELKMSYRAIWARIKATEERMGKQLLVRSKGGAAGGGAELTPFARELMAQFLKLRRQVLAKSDTFFKAYCEPLIRE